MKMRRNRKRKRKEERRGWRRIRE